MTSPFYCGVIILALFLGVPILAMVVGIASGGKKQISFLNNYIKARGYHFENPEMALIPEMSTMQMWKTVDFKSMKRATDGLSGIREFSQMSAASMGFILIYEGRRMTVFAHSYSFRNSSVNTSTVIKLRAAKLSCDSLPIFRLEKSGAVTMVETLVDKVLKTGGARPSFQSIALSQHSKFSSLYRLTSENEQKTRSFLTDSKIAALERSPLQGICATSPDCLVYFEHGPFSNEKSYDDFIVRAQTAFDSLLK